MALSRLVALFSTLALVFSSDDGGGGIEPNTITYSSLMDGYCLRGDCRLCVVSPGWLQARGELRLNPISLPSYLLMVVEGRFTHSYRMVSPVLWIGIGSHGVGDESWSILCGGASGERVGVGVSDTDLASMKAWSTCAMVNPTGSTFVLYGWSSDGVDAYRRWLPKNPGLIGKAISGVVVADCGVEFLGALGLNSTVLGLKVWALGLLSLWFGYFWACLATISESMPAAMTLMVEEEGLGDTSSVKDGSRVSNKPGLGHA